ncbi:hypothetical protein D6764_04525 [Candidatus Woesearchaeota archaeon]|nr:MAG: hypothetical protein D6764_04525 [Candidatus Woesearchaeota archaeon]
MLSRRKKAIMGIGTLIIFIATILVAAVAAGVLISTSGVLQQRALLAGTEARKRITNSIEVISLLAHGNSTAETLNDFEAYIRLQPGSDPIQMRKFDIQIITEGWDQAATLQHKSMDPSEYEVGQVDNNSWTKVIDIDGDGTEDYVRLFEANSTTNGEAVLYFNLSDAGMSRPIYLGYNLSSTSVRTLKVQDKVILDSDYNGYMLVNISGNASNNTIPASTSFILRNWSEECAFDHLIPETRYCFVVMHGNDDTVLDSGERLKLLYKATPDHALGTGQEFRMIFTSEKGRLSEIRAYTPDVVRTTKVPLWPLN